jgi:hypothetical protein
MPKALIGFEGCPLVEPLMPDLSGLRNGYRLLPQSTVECRALVLTPSPRMSVIRRQKRQNIL